MAAQQLPAKLAKQQAVRLEKELKYGVAWQVRIRQWLVCEYGVE